MPHSEAMEVQILQPLRSITTPRWRKMRWEASPIITVSPSQSLFPAHAFDHPVYKGTERRVSGVLHLMFYWWRIRSPLDVQNLNDLRSKACGDWNETQGDSSWTCQQVAHEHLGAPGSLSKWLLGNIKSMSLKAPFPSKSLSLCEEQERLLCPHFMTRRE